MVENRERVEVIDEEEGDKALMDVFDDEDEDLSPRTSSKNDIGRYDKRRRGGGTSNAGFSSRKSV